MGQSGADFGAVSTDGLMIRARRRIDKAAEDTSKLLMTRKSKERQLVALAMARAAMEAEYMAVRSGLAPEKALRDKLVQLLDPQISGGRKGTRIRW
jgi:hypothetical protein